MRSIKLLPLLFLGFITLAMPAASPAQVSVGLSIRVGPPPLPVYVQPACPEPGYHWIPGYWAYGPEGYYWVPGTWVEPPEVGVLWTPGYWGWRNGFYLWNGGYWGPHVGFYGGINYGYGYTGVGFAGGYWRGRDYFYNRSVTNVNVTVIHNSYNRTVINERTINRVSFNGGAGGTSARATVAEEHAAHEHHFQATTAQSQHEHFASTNHEQLASINHGHPNVAASPKAGVFSGHGVEHTHDAGFQKFSRDNTSPSGGSGPQGGSKIKSTDAVAAHGNIHSAANVNSNTPHNTVNGNASSNPSKTYHADARIRQNNGAQNNVAHGSAHVNAHASTHVNEGAHVHGQSDGQHGGEQHNDHAPHSGKH